MNTRKTALPLFIAMLACFCLPLFSAQESEAAPKISVENPLFDFGDIDRGAKVTTKFKFKNSGSAPLEIINVATSCGCTSAVPDKTTYAVGESGEIPVTFDSGRFSGPITKRVTIRTNDPASPDTVVTIKGNVVVEINAKPTSLFFARAKLGETTTQELTVSTQKLDKLEISDLKADPEFLSVVMERVDDRNIKIKVTADGSQFPDGRPRLNGTVSYRTNSETQPEMKHIVAVNVEHPIRVTPSSVYFFASKAGKERETFMRLKSTDDKTFDIKDINTDLEFIKVSVQDDQTKEKALMITLAPDAPEGKFQGKITLNTSLDAQPQLVIPVRGSVVK